VRVDQPVKALTGLIDRNVRWLANLIPLEKLPGVKTLFSQLLEGKISVANLISHDSTDSEKLKLEENRLEELGIVSNAEEWGLKIVKAMVTDIRIPESISEANAEKEVEKAQQISEGTEFDTFWTLLGAGDVEEGKKAFKKMTPEKRTDAIQTEREKATRIIVDGTGDPIVKAGYLAGGSKK